MRKSLMVLLSMVLMGSAPLVFAAKTPGDDPGAAAAPAAGPSDDANAGQGVGHMSEEGAVNSNSPATGDQMKGQERVDERHALDPSGEHKHSGKSKSLKKGKEKSE